MKTEAPILLSNELAYKIAGNSKLRKQILCLVHLKALYPEGRFKCDKQTVQATANAVGMKHARYFIEGRLYPLEQLKLITKQNGCYYLADWPTILKHFDIDKPKGRYYEHIQLIPGQRLEEICLMMAWQYEKRRFEYCQQKAVNGMPELQYSIKSVCGTLNKEAVAYHQLTMFCKDKARLYDAESEYFFLYARKGERKFLYKADTHISTQHLSKLYNYKNKNGFCYRKKLMQKQGLIDVYRREYVINPGTRTNSIQRATGIGTYYFDSVNRVQKLRIVDKVIFYKPGVKQPLKANTDAPAQTLQAA